MGKFISEHSDKIFGESFLGIFATHIGFVMANIDMILLIIISITGFVVFSILNDVDVKNNYGTKTLEKHKVKFSESLSEGLDIFRGSGTGGSGAGGKEGFAGEEGGFAGPAGGFAGPAGGFAIERSFDKASYHTRCNEITDEAKRSKCLLI